MHEVMAVVAEPREIPYFVILPIFIDMVDEQYVRVFYYAQDTLRKNPSPLKYPFISEHAVLPVAMLLLFEFLIVPGHATRLTTEELVGVVECFGWLIDNLTATKTGD